MVLLALICFLASAIWSGILRAWPMALLALGLVFYVAAGQPGLHL